MTRTARGGIGLPNPQTRDVLGEVTAALMDAAAVSQGKLEINAATGSTPVALTAEQCRAKVLKFSGTLAAAKTFTVPATETAAVFIAENATTGGFTITIKLAGEAGAGVAIQSGKSKLCYHDDVNMKEAGGFLSSSTLNSGIVAFWPLDETSGTRVDTVGANDLTDNNTVTQATGKVGSAAQFTAANSEHLSIADNTDLSTGNIDFTFAGWVYLDSKGAVRGVFEKDDNSVGLRDYGLYYTNTDDRFHFYVFDPSNNYAEVIASALGSPSTATWYFFVVWHDAAANTINVQFNNGTVNSTAHSPGVKDSAAIFSIGQGGGNSYMDGRVDALGFWKKVLTASEKTELYNSGNGREYGF